MISSSVSCSKKVYLFFIIYLNMFSDVDNISGSHGDQKIPFFTIGKKIILDLVKCREVFTWSAKRLNPFLQILRGNSQSICFPCSINIC